MLIMRRAVMILLSALLLPVNVAVATPPVPVPGIFDGVSFQDVSKKSVLVGASGLGTEDDDAEIGTAGDIAGANRTSSVSTRVCSYGGRIIECSTGMGNWSSRVGAWCTPAPTQPPFSDPAWGGRSDGAIYLCTRPRFDLTPDANMTATRWLPDPPEAEAVDPREVALRLLARLDLEAIDIGLQPRGDTPKRMSYVGWNVWMWADSPSQEKWGPISASDSGSGVAVSLSAEVDRVEWDMGDGTVVTCGRGRPWTMVATSGKNVASPDCGHVYEEMGTYTVTARSYWSVNWSGAGQSGTLPLTLERSVDHIVGEWQSVNVPAGRR